MPVTPTIVAIAKEFEFAHRCVELENILKVTRNELNEAHRIIYKLKRQLTSEQKAHVRKLTQLSQGL